MWHPAREIEGLGVSQSLWILRFKGPPDTIRGTHSRKTEIFLGSGTHVILMVERSENERRVGRKSNS